MTEKTKKAGKAEMILFNADNLRFQSNLGDQKDFIDILPYDIISCYKIARGRSGKSRISRILTNSTDLSDDYPLEVFNIIGKYREKESCVFDESELAKTMSENLKKVFDSTAQEGSLEENINFSEALEKLEKEPAGKMLDEEYQIFERIKNADKVTAFLSLLLLALTWREVKLIDDSNGVVDSDSIMSKVSEWIVPGVSRRVKAVREKQWREAGKSNEADNIKAQSLLDKADEDLEAHLYEACVSDCKGILKYEGRSVSDKIIGKAYYYIVECCSNHNCSFGAGYNEAEFKRRAVKYGCREAITKYNLKGIDSLTYLPRRSEKGMPGLTVICNKENECSNAFIASMPEIASKDLIIPEANDALLLDSAAGFLAKDEPKNGMILLCDEELHRNFKNLISLLTLFKREMTGKSYEARPVCTIYIRTEERYDSLIDTAIKQSAGIPVRVIPIDAHKLAAQQLLGLHPLFYPLRDLSAEFLNTSAATLSFVIVSDNDNDLNTWLIREAYWLGCFTYTGINLKITLLSPNAEGTVDALRGLYPGMFGEKRANESAFEIKAVELSDLRSEMLIKTINDLGGAIGSFLYFAVNAASCVDGLETARRLREWSLRRETDRAAAKKRPIIIQDLPVIAFFCDDDDVAHLTDNLSIQGANHGNAWYNDLRLIPFGMPSYLYGFDTIGGGQINKLAECFHLQYCGANSSNFKSIAEKELYGFYANIYDRDSSIAAALSMPCRLFHAGDTRKNANEPYSHIVPKGWSIRNANAYTDGNAIKEMTELLDRALKKDKELAEKLTKYEHARWMRFMVSRGWVASSPAQAFMHMKNGSPKHQLFAARMHPCITPIFMLSELQDKLYIELSKINDPRAKTYEATNALIQIDRSSIESTVWIIRQAWLPDMVKVDDDKELE